MGIRFTKVGLFYCTYNSALDKDLYDFAKDVISGKEKSTKTYRKIAERISDRLAEDIKRIVGFSVEGYGNEIDASQIQRIWKDHSMKDIKDIGRIRYAIDNYDDIRVGNNKTKYKNDDNSVAKTVELVTKIGNKFYYVVEAVPDAKIKALHVISAYINKNNTFPGEAVSKDPSRYVQDEPQSNVLFKGSTLNSGGNYGSKNNTLPDSNASKVNISPSSENASKTYINALKEAG